MWVEGRGLVVTEEAGAVIPEVQVRGSLDISCFGGPYMLDRGVVENGCQVQTLVQDIVEEGVGFDVLVLLACTLLLSESYFYVTLAGGKW